MITAGIAAVLLGACNWVSLATNAVTYRTIARGETANVAVRDSVIYATLAEDGLALVDARTGVALDTLPPPAGSESVDDLAVAGDLLFVLDAREPGHLSVLSLADPVHPRLVSRPREVPVGPFSGVAAGTGIAVVSGGTSALTAWRYDAAGAVTGPVATTDLGRGQPDVQLAPDGRTAYVSTHYWGPYFGLDLVRLDDSTGRLDRLGRIALEGAGFTEGGARPANFPIATAVMDDGKVLVAYRGGVAVIDATDPRRPRLVQHLDVGGPAVSVDVQGTGAVVAVAGARAALAILDFGSGRGWLVRRIPLPPGTFPAGVALTPARAIVAAGALGVLVFDR